MIKSMTGYGRAQRQIGRHLITAEIKSVNHRFFEFAARVPRSCGYLEEKLKSEIQPLVSRGKVEMTVGFQTLGGETGQVQFNNNLAAAYLASLRAFGAEHGLADSLTLSDVARLPDVFSVVRQEEDEGELWEEVRQVAAEAVASFVAMRTAEGTQLAVDLRDRLAGIEVQLAFIRLHAPQTVAAYRERLTVKLAEVLADRRLDESRVLTEAAIYADRVAVDEETVRLASHILQFREILDHNEPIGRKLDFLVQEMNREANTIGSKAQDVSMAQAVVQIKSDIEKIREQIQNIE